MKTFPTTHQTRRTIEQLASEWLLRREAGLSAEAASELGAWRSADPRNEEAFSMLEAAWAVFSRAQQRGAATTIVTQLSLLSRRRARRNRLVGAAAAVLILGLTFGWNTMRLAPTAPATASMAAFEAVRKLPDGSLVELNVGAKINVRYEAARRRVQLLSGEAHFSVTKDPARPFIVEVAGMEVRAVGTAFTVDLQAAAVEVIVTEGRVALERAVSAPSPRDLTPPPAHAATVIDAGSRARLGLASAAEILPQVSAMTDPELEQRLAWRKPRVEFDNLELPQAIAIMNRHNQLQIVVGDAATGRLRVSGTFLPDNPEGFVRILEGTFDLRAERRGENEIVLRAAR